MKKEIAETRDKLYYSAFGKPMIFELYDEQGAFHDHTRHRRFYTPLVDTQQAERVRARARARPDTDAGI